jgi:hypothetical protein
LYRERPAPLPSSPKQDFSESSTSFDSAYLSRTTSVPEKLELEPVSPSPAPEPPKKSLLSHIPGTSKLRKLIKKKKKVAVPLLAS